MNGAVECVQRTMPKVSGARRACAFKVGFVGGRRVLSSVFFVGSVCFSSKCCAGFRAVLRGGEGRGGGARAARVELPDDAWLQVVLALEKHEDGKNLENLARVASCCRAFRALVREDEVWEAVIVRLFGDRIWERLSGSGMISDRVRGVSLGAAQVPFLPAIRVIVSPSL